MSRADGEDAAEMAVDPDRLLAGEDAKTTHIEDAAHWIAVYSELVLFKERLVDSAQNGLLGIRDEVARKEVATTDVVLLASERDRLRRRLDFWKQREQEMRRH